MSDQQKPAAHDGVRLVALDKNGRTHVEALDRYFTPDEAVALGYALFEHGLYLKGKMK